MVVTLLPLYRSLNVFWSFVIITSRARQLAYRYNNTIYHIDIIQVNNSEEMIITVDGIIMEDKIITLKDDGVEHAAMVKF